MWIHKIFKRNVSWFGSRLYDVIGQGGFWFPISLVSILAKNNKFREFLALKTDIFWSRV